MSSRPGERRIGQRIPKDAITEHNRGQGCSCYSARPEKRGFQLHEDGGDVIFLRLVDLLENPQLAAGDQIVAVPTLVRRLPPPLKKIIGDLSIRNGYWWDWI